MKTGGGYFQLSPHDTTAEKILSLGKNNKRISLTILGNYLNAMFESSRTYGLFTSYFDEELYHYAANFYAGKSFGRFRRTYSVWGIAEVLEDVEISNQKRWRNDDKRHFLEEDFCQIDDSAQIIRKFGYYLTARIDIKFLPDKTGGDMQILSLSDSRATAEKPAWFQKQGVGYVLTSYQGELELTAKTNLDGQIQLLLRGQHVRNPEDRSKNIPYWIDYTKLTVNDVVILDALTPTCHDKPYDYNFNVSGGKEFKLKVEWVPHGGSV